MRIRSAVTIYGRPEEIQEHVARFGNVALRWVPLQGYTEIRAEGRFSDELWELKRRLETGEVPTTEGQPTGRGA